MAEWICALLWLSNRRGNQLRLVPSWSVGSAPVKSAEERIIYGVCFEIPLNRKEQPVHTSQKSTVSRVSC